jgi:molybdenum cofactor biosynthesis protein B
MGAKDHKTSAEQEACKFSIFTISDTRTIQDDESGKLALEILTKFGHSPVDHRIIKNERRLIEAAVMGALGGEAELIVTVGGTGISKKDLSIDAVRPLITKEMPGFGELFRAMSVKEIGTAVIMSRATLGVTEKLKVVCALPGSPAAVKLALEGILVNELKHLFWELRRYSDPRK